MNPHHRLRTLALVLACALPVPALADTFTNPIKASGADPWVVQYKGQYFYARSNGNNRIWIDRATDLEDIGTIGTGAATSQLVYQAPTGTQYSSQTWAPELHFLDNKWYIYYAASDGNNDNHRMYVLESTSADPQGPYVFKGKIAPTTDRWAIDGTVLTHNGSNYFVWSGWEGTTDGRQDLYIAQMSNPWTLTGERVRIATPTYSWERHGLAINEGPSALQYNGATHIIYSGSGYWRPEYALGQLTLTGADPMNPGAWTKTPTPVFSRTANTVGVGHASFVKSPDGGEDWIVYHAHDNPTQFQERRDVRIQEFSYNPDNSPNFGPPVDPGVPLPTPSGRAVVTFIPNYSFERTEVTAGSGSASGVTSMTSTGTTGVIDNQGRFFTVISGGDGKQVGYVGSSGTNGVSTIVGDILKPGTYEFSAGLAIASNQLNAANAAPGTYELRLESVGRNASGNANEADKLLLASTTVSSTTLNSSSFTFNSISANIPLLSDRYNSFLRLSVFSVGGGSSSWQAKVENLNLNFTPSSLPAAPTPVAHWRFEEGPSGAGLAAAATTADSADNDDPLRSTTTSTSPRFSIDTALAVVPNTNQVNRYSLDFDPAQSQHLYTSLPGDLQSKLFSAFTIEATFKLDTLDRWQVVVGKDGKPTAASIAPLQLKARNDNDKIQIEIIDGAGNPRQVSSVDALTTDTWFHVAATSDGLTLSLYLDRGDGLGYVLQGTTPVTGGALFDSTGLWTVGRGMFNNSPTDYLDGHIDEIRISDSALNPTQFLFFEPAGAPSWNVDASGTWSAQPNWSRATPNSVTAVANFTDAITAPRTVTLDAPRTASTLNFRNANSYTLAGTATLTIDTNGSTGAINVSRGSHTIAAPLHLARSTTVSVTPADAVLTLAGDMTSASIANLTKTGAGALHAKHVRTNSLSVSAGLLRILPTGAGPTPSSTSRVTSLAIPAAGQLDLSNNALVIDYPSLSPLSTIRQYLAAARTPAGDFSGLTGITSSSAANDPSRLTAIGYLENSLRGPSATNFLSQTTDSTSLILMFTYYGDANLDSLVNADDFALLDKGFATGGTVWSLGDFNYDGTVNSADYLLIDRVFLSQSQSPNPAFLSQRESQFGATYVSELLTSIPEPSLASLSPLFSLLFKRRRTHA